MSARSVRLIISGRVQGVGYRDFVRGEAEARNVKGWVRNRSDGAVEAHACGDAESIEELIAICWRGPPASRVSEVRVEARGAPPAPYAGFKILPTV